MHIHWSLHQIKIQTLSTFLMHHFSIIQVPKYIYYFKLYHHRRILPDLYKNEIIKHILYYVMLLLLYVTSMNCIHHVVSFIYFYCYVVFDWVDNPQFIYLHIFSVIFEHLCLKSYKLWIKTLWIWCINLFDWHNNSFFKKYTQM